MDLKYKVGDKVELKTNKPLLIDTIKINAQGVFYYTQSNNILYTEDDIKGKWGKGSKDKTYTARNVTKTKSNNNAVSDDK